MAAFPDSLTQLLKHNGDIAALLREASSLASSRTAADPTSTKMVGWVRNELEKPEAVRLKPVYKQVCDLSASFAEVNIEYTHRPYQCY